MVLQVIISAIVGYSLLVVCYNERNWWRQDLPAAYRYGSLLSLFLLVGVVGSESQLLANYLLFNQVYYAPFQAGGVYLFNGILTTILGFMTLKWVASETDTEPTQPVKALPQTEETALINIPLRKGETTSFIPLDDVIYFEAYDNYSFLHDTAGNRSLCNYSLAHLEPRLTGRFLRVHRKYLVNVSRVASITPHLKGRYVIAFADAAGSSVTSSSSYSEVVKELTRI